LAIARAFKWLEDVNLERLLDKYVIEENIDDYYCSKW
jgi:ubiquitin carboxyl-terminal hydrolase 2/21/ubiquitin carboxyl-terminal hydrolase 8